ncbi:hypothetical protein SprV_0501788300 [Sparganum proliferum]
MGAGDPISRSGCSKVERRDVDVARVIHNGIGGQLSCLLQSISSRLITPSPPLRGANFKITISALSKMTSSNYANSKCYEEMHVLLATVSKASILIFLDVAAARDAMSLDKSRRNADLNETNNFFASTNAVYDPCIE